VSGTARGGTLLVMVDVGIVTAQMQERLEISPALVAPVHQGQAVFHSRELPAPIRQTAGLTRQV
jgi:hypothetical protein